MDAKIHTCSCIFPEKMSALKGVILIRMLPYSDKQHSAYTKATHADWHSCSMQNLQRDHSGAFHDSFQHESTINTGLSTVSTPQRGSSMVQQTPFTSVYLQGAEGRLDLVALVLTEEGGVDGTKGVGGSGGLKGLFVQMRAVFALLWFPYSSMDALSMCSYSFP